MDERSEKPEELLERISREFCIGGHKAAGFARVLTKAKIIVVSDIAADTVKLLFMVPAAHAQEALDEALENMGESAKVLVMTFGGSTLPRVRKRNEGQG